MNAAIRSLGDFTIGAAGTQVGDWVTGLAGILAATLQARLAYGSGGTAIKVYIQTSIDEGTTPIDIACITFGTEGAQKVVNLSGSTPKGTPATATDATLADNTALDGVLGDRFRAKVVSTGVYAGSTVLSLRLAPR